MKLKQLVEASGALSRLSNAPLRAAVAFRLKRILRVVNPELETYNEARVKLAASLGKLSEDGSQYDIPKEKVAAFNEQLEALWGEDVDLGVPLLSVEDLGDTAVTAVDLMALEWLFTEDAPQPTKKQRGKR